MGTTDIFCAASASENNPVSSAILLGIVVPVFRAEVLFALDEKATRDGNLGVVKRRKIFYVLGDAARAIFADDFPRVKSGLDPASKAAVRKLDNPKAAQ